MSARAIWVAVTVAVTAAGCFDRDRRAPSDKPTPEPLALPQTPQVDPNTTAGYVGVLTPREAADVPAAFTTKVLDYAVNLGDQVEVGTELAHLDPEPLQEALAVAKAELSQASVARSAAASQLKTERRALRMGVASKTSVADAEFKAREAGTIVAGAKAKVRALEDKIKSLTLAAPIAGKVALRYIEPGGRVEEGQPVVRVISSDELFVKFAIPADQTGKLNPGDPIDVTLESKGTKVAAVVKRVSPELDPVAQMILAEAELADPSAEGLQSGVVCRIRIAKK